MPKLLTALPFFVSLSAFLLLTGWSGRSFAKTYYQVLDVPRGASIDVITMAYRRLAMKYHPDRDKVTNSGSKDKFQEVQEAFEVLKDPEKRAQYDSNLKGDFTTNINRSNRPSPNSSWDATWLNITRAVTIADLIRAKDAALAVAPTSEDFTQAFLYKSAELQTAPLSELLIRYMLKFWTLKPRADQIAAVTLASGNNALLYGTYRTFLQYTQDPTRYVELLNFNFQKHMMFGERDYILAAVRETIRHFREINKSEVHVAELFDVLQQRFGPDSARQAMRLGYPDDSSFRVTCGEFLRKIFR